MGARTDDRDGHATPASLLERLRDPAPADWERFVALYTPLLRCWAARLGAVGPDAADLVQEVFVLLVRTLPAFRYDADRRFRGWLWTVTANKWRELGRRKSPAGPLPEVAGPDPADAAAEDEYRRHLTAAAVRVMRGEFAPDHWRAFWATAVEGRPAAAVAADLGTTPAAVYAAKSRVLRRLRDELRGLLD